MKPGRYCVIFNSATVGKKTRLESRHSKRKAAESEAKTLNRSTGMGGFYGVYICKNLGYAFKQEIGLEGRRKR